MKILYDGYVFSAQKNGGITRYFAELIRRLPIEWSPIVRLGQCTNSVELLHPHLRRQEVSPFNGLRPKSLVRALTRSYAELQDFSATYDLLHPTYHFRLPKRLIYKRRRPLVVTVFDMIAENFPAELDPSGKEIRAKKRMIESADAIICISNYTKEQLQNHYAVPDARITVTYLAAGLEVAPADKADVPPRPYILFLGNRGTYKNFRRTLQALAKVTKSWPELTLCIVGNRLDDPELELITSLGIMDRIRQLGFVDDSMLASLYRSSEALVYPSLQEGFGIPPLEAMACGTVVIASNAGSLPEVLGDAAISVDPESVDQLASAMLSLRDLGPVRQELIRRGILRAQRFSWDEMVRQTLVVYESLVC